MGVYMFQLVLLLHFEFFEPHCPRAEFSYSLAHKWT